MKPEHFNSIVDAAILTAAPVEDDDDDILGSPSNAIKLGYDIKRLINGKIGLSIMSKDPNSQADAENLIKLMNIYWGTKVTKHARVILEERRFYAAKNLPLPEDIQQLSNYLRDSILNVDLTKADATNYREVGKLIEAKLVTYNRRRTGEVQAIRYDVNIVIMSLYFVLLITESEKYYFLFYLNMTKYFTLPHFNQPSHSKILQHSTLSLTKFIVLLHSFKMIMT